MNVLKRTQLALSRVQYPDFVFKPKQMQCLESLLQGRDVLTVLPTGYGKSLLFQLLPFFLPSKGERNIVIVVFPLNSIIEDQLETLKKMNIKAALLKTRHHESIIPSFTNPKSTAEVEVCLITEDVLKGNIDILLAHPEDLLSENGRNVLRSSVYQRRVAACAFDEVYTLCAVVVSNLLLLS